ncbi:MAG: 30S ribosomal protein S12 methylthiotransferase RimO [Victivallaceae bacterium]|nr:30S ribosomal protein S12 methylthiotransferase RimO [Victivallaceae bacterium]
MQKKIQRGAFFPVSLGCPKNLNDLEVISGGLLAAGWSIADSPENADLYLVNTCAFIPAARNEAVEEIVRGIEWKKAAPHRLLAVSGCLTAYDRDQTFRRRFSEVDFWLGIDDIARADEVLQGKAASASCRFLADETLPRLQLTVPHLAYLKIADGCNNCCTYCAIPLLRGRLRSLPTASIVGEARQRISSGVRELVVVAQDISAYGMDRPGSGENLAKLLGELNRIEGDFVIRLLYTHPAHYSDELIDAINANGKVMPYLDIPLQHISDPLLRAMNRHVSQKEVVDLIAKLRRNIPDLVLRSTFITGFPGESEAQFEELADFCRETKFERLGVFPFSPEPGTAAAKLPHQLPGEIAEARATLLMKRQISRMRRMQKNRIGTRERILVDACDKSVAWGRGVADAPEIDNFVIVENPPRRCRQGEFLDVEIVGSQNCDVIARAMAKKRK